MGYHVIYIYLESPCHNELNGGQSVNLQARIADLWRFKARNEEKVIEEDRLAIFRLVYGEKDFWIR